MSTTLPNSTKNFIIKSKGKKKQWLRSWTDGNWDSSPSSYLPCGCYHSNTGPLVGRSCTSSGRARSHPKDAAPFSTHKSQKYSSSSQQHNVWWASAWHNSYSFLQNTAIKQVGFAGGSNLCKEFPTNGPFRPSPPLANKLGDIRATKFSSTYVQL